MTFFFNWFINYIFNLYLNVRIGQAERMLYLFVYKDIFNRINVVLWELWVIFEFQKFWTCCLSLNFGHAEGKLILIFVYILRYKSPSLALLLWHVYFSFFFQTQREFCLVPKVVRMGFCFRCVSINKFMSSGFWGGGACLYEFMRKVSYFNFVLFLKN